MSQKNVDGFRRGVDALGRGDLETFLEEVAPDVIFDPLRAPVSGKYEGHDGIRRFFVDTEEAFEVFRPTYDDIRDLGDRVLAIGSLHFRAAGGGPETDVPTAGIATFRDDRLIHWKDWKDFGDRRKALEAAGLTE